MREKFKGPQLFLAYRDFLLTRVSSLYLDVQKGPLSLVEVKLFSSFLPSIFDISTYLKNRLEINLVISVNMTLSCNFRGQK